MYTLGTSEGTQANRVKKYLEVKYMDLDYTAEPDGEGFVMFRFPTLDEEEFRNMVFLLKRLDGVTLMGVDTQLTEKNIMKLTNLIKEFAPTTQDQNRPKYLEALRRMLKTWSKKEYKDDIDKWTQFGMDVQQIVDVWEAEIEDNEEQAAYDKGFYAEGKEDKVRSLIRKTIRK